MRYKISKAVAKGVFILIILSIYLAIPKYSFATSYTMYSIADTFTCTWWPDQNFGSDGQMKVMWSGQRGHIPTPPPPDSYSYSYIKFDLTTIPEIEEIINVTFYAFHAGGANSDGKIVDIYHIDNDDWDENTVKWDNRPTVNEFLGSSGPFTSFGFYASWNISGYDFSEDLLDNTLSFALMPHEKSYGHTDFYTSNAPGRKPYIIIETSPASTPIPEPTTWQFLVLGFLGIIFKKNYKNLMINKK